MSFDEATEIIYLNEKGLNPFRTGRCLSTNTAVRSIATGIVSIPFEQGDVFRRRAVLDPEDRRSVSIPFEQGDVFRQSNFNQLIKNQGLNPFRTGRCLSTKEKGDLFSLPQVSIPFEQGDVFRL